ncbi:helix-turn-helix domain-containing protein [Paenibacillus sp. JX-17]|uniref:Helix-turn-helix domain-containing protein n=1 Tax=Paenibacillus lacisoli TaxID=3064525 RepID=A0ABT9C8X8_9BACL|nr:helix-turn-helix domain-containing protein [Paenibacillus sp. JX-17]MDO7905686.1 helix-turn-helix domain-containing protein [Paenibacillus sp. JX-17]
MDGDKQQSKLMCRKVEQSYQMISKKWALPIIHSLMDEPKRFSEINAYIPDLSKRMLNERIKELEELGIIIRNVIAERPVRTEYSLTRKGKELGNALNNVVEWAEKWL